MIENPNVICNDCGFCKQNAQLEGKIERLEKQLEIVKKYLPLIKRNVSVGSLAYTYVANAQTEIKELNK